MKIQSNKRLIQYCDFISVLSLFAAIAYGLSQILPLCYEMGKDDSDTFIWKALVQTIECYAIFFIGLLAYFMASNVKKGKVFCRINQRILSAIGISTMLSGVLINVIVNLTPIDVFHQNSILLIVIGTVFVLVSFVFEVGIRMQEEQDLTI